jgi:prepilin peptidase CpaA
MKFAVLAFLGIAEQFARPMQAAEPLVARTILLLRPIAGMDGGGDVKLLVALAIELA